MNTNPIPEKCAHPFTAMTTIGLKCAVCGGMIGIPERLKERFNEIIVESAVPIICDDEHLLNLMHQAYQLADGQSKWIDVNERLPEVGEDYNVVLELNDDGEPVSGIMEFDGIKHIWLYPGTEVPCNCVTHWQSLPHPPTKNQP